MPAKGSKPVWCLVMFDLPVKTKKETTEANRFRNLLLDMGFSRSQFSVYVQYLPLASRAHVLVKQIKSNLPEGGDIRIVSISDYEWSNAIRFTNKKDAPPDEQPTQLLIFWRKIGEKTPGYRPFLSRPEVYQGFIELNPSLRLRCRACLRSLSGIYRTKPQPIDRGDSAMKKATRGVSNWTPAESAGEDVGSEVYLHAAPPFPKAPEKLYPTNENRKARHKSWEKVSNPDLKSCQVGHIWPLQTNFQPDQKCSSRRFFNHLNLVSVKCLLTELLKGLSWRMIFSHLHFRHA